MEYAENDGAGRVPGRAALNFSPAPAKARVAAGANTENLRTREEVGARGGGTEIVDFSAALRLLSLGFAHSIGTFQRYKLGNLPV